jgi:tetratricopeptide (TPR) repeat protein
MKKKNVKHSENYHEKVLHSRKKETPEREKRIQGQARNDKLSRYKYYLAGITAVITFIIYLVSLKNDFVEWDDSQYVFENLHIRSFDLSLFKWAFFDFYAANWHPLTWLSHALDYAVWGLNPMGHHLTNNILHAANTFFVVLLVARLLESWQAGKLASSHDTNFTLIAAATTGLLFGIHPLHVESVAWVAERKDLLCALFFLLSIMMYMSYVSHKTFRTYLIPLVLFSLALLSKPMAVSLPFVLLIFDWYPFARITTIKTFKTVLIEKLPFIAISIGSSILTILAQKAGGAVTAIDVIPLSTRMLVAAESLIAYLWKMIAPTHLIPYYPYPKDVSLFSAEYLSAIILAAMITAVCILMAKKQRLLLSAWTYYVVTLLPVLGLVQVGGQSMADRYTYLPSLAPFLLFGVLSAWIWKKTTGLQKQPLSIKLLNAGVAILLIVSLTLLSVRQISVWKNTFSLWTYVIEDEPKKAPIAYNNRGRFFYSRGQFARAIEDFNNAITLDPSSFKAFLNRGAAFLDSGRFDLAAADFDKAIVLNPSYSEAYNSRGSLFGMSGSLDKAIEQFTKAIELDPNYSAAYGNRASAYSLIGQNNRALQDLDRAIMLDRYYAENYLNRGNIYLESGNRELATSDFRKACDLGNKSGCSSLQSVSIGK